MIQCGSTVLDVASTQWVDSNGNNIPDTDEVKKGDDKYLSGDSLKCYQKIVSETQPIRPPTNCEPDYKLEFYSYFKKEEQFDENTKLEVRKIVDCYAPQFKDHTLHVRITVKWNEGSPYEGASMSYQIAISGIKDSKPKDTSCPDKTCFQPQVISTKFDLKDSMSPFSHLEILPFLDASFKLALGI